jgi:hypothetical protein
MKISQLRFRIRVNFGSFSFQSVKLRLEIFNVHIFYSNFLVCCVKSFNCLSIIRINSGWNWSILIIELLLCFLFEFVGLPEWLFKFKNLTGLKTIKSNLFTELFIKSSNCLLKRTLLRAKFQLFLELSIFLLKSSDFSLLLVNMLLEFWNFIFFCDKKHALITVLSWWYCFWLLFLSSALFFLWLFSYSLRYLLLLWGSILVIN